MKSASKIVLALSAVAFATSLFFSACSNDNDPVQKKTTATGGSTSKDAGTDHDSGTVADAG